MTIAIDQCVAMAELCSSWITLSGVVSAVRHVDQQMVNNSFLFLACNFSVCALLCTSFTYSSIRTPTRDASDKFDPLEMWREEFIHVFLTCPLLAHHCIINIWISSACVFPPLSSIQYLEPSPHTICGWLSHLLLSIHLISKSRCEIQDTTRQDTHLKAFPIILLSSFSFMICARDSWHCSNSVSSVPNRIADKTENAAFESISSFEQNHFQCGRRWEWRRRNIIAMSQGCSLDLQQSRLLSDFCFFVFIRAVQQKKERIDKQKYQLEMAFDWCIVRKVRRAQKIRFRLSAK